MLSTFLVVCSVLVTMSQARLLILYHDWALKWFGEYLLQSAERYSSGDFRSCAVTTSTTPCNTTGVERLIIDHVHTIIPYHLVSCVHRVHVDGQMWALWPEQMTRNVTVQAFRRARRDWPRVGYLHYSEANMRIMRSHCPECRMQLVPFAPLARLVRHHWNVKKRHDVCFTGTVSQRRTTLNNAAKRAVTKIELFGNQRDVATAECRVILNTHYDDNYVIFESLRVAWALSLGVLVVSERSLPERLTALTNHTIFFSKPDDIASVLNDTLHHYEAHRKRLMRFLNTQYENTCSVALQETFLR